MKTTMRIKQVRNHTTINQAWWYSAIGSENQMLPLMEGQSQLHCFLRFLCEDIMLGPIKLYEKTKSIAHNKKNSKGNKSMKTTMKQLLISNYTRIKWSCWYSLIWVEMNHAHAERQISSNQTVTRMQLYIVFYGSFVKILCWALSNSTRKQKASLTIKKILKEINQWIQQWNNYLYPITLESNGPVDTH